MAVSRVAAEGAPAAAGFKVFPESINLNTSRHVQSLVLQFVQPDGVTRDVTSEATVTVSNPKLASIDGAIIKPLADGSGNITVSPAGQTLTIPLTVKHAAAHRPISFKLDVMPVFMKA